MRPARRRREPYGEHDLPRERTVRRVRPQLVERRDRGQVNAYFGCVADRMNYKQERVERLWT